MIDIANITEDEAFQRINSYWGGKDFTSEDDIVFHEGPEYWVKTIYYEQWNWWNYKQEDLTPRKI
ncbi:hypothetical protein NYE80_10715 [Paenibacillus sp. FSL H7-0357]